VVVRAAASVRESLLRAALTGYVHMDGQSIPADENDEG